MTILARSTTVTTTSGGAATGEISFSGFPWAKVHRVVVADAQFDDNYALVITDAAGRTIVSKTVTSALDGVIGADMTDDAGAAVTMLGADLKTEATVADGTDQAILAPGAAFKGPFAVAITSGGATVSGTVSMVVEV